MPQKLKDFFLFSGNLDLCNSEDFRGLLLGQIFIKAEDDDLSASLIELGNGLGKRPPDQDPFLYLLCRLLH